MTIEYDNNGTYDFTGKDNRTFEASKIIARGQWIYLRVTGTEQRMSIQADDVEPFIEMLRRAAAL